MININNYISEKLYISKDYNLGKGLPSEEEFMELLKNFKGGLDLEKVFGKGNLPYDEKERDIEEISVQQDFAGYDTMYYTYFDTEDGETGYDAEGELDLDVFSDEQILNIYDYMQNHVK